MPAHKDLDLVVVVLVLTTLAHGPVVAEILVVVLTISPVSKHASSPSHKPDHRIKPLNVK